MHKTIKQARQRGLRIVKGRNSNEIGLKPVQALTKDNLNWANENKYMLKLEFDVSIGTTLGKIIKFIIPTKLLNQVELLGCGCDKYERRMDRWGFDACLAKIPVILKRLRQQSRRMGTVGKILKWVPRPIIDLASLQLFFIAFTWEGIKYLKNKRSINRGMLRKEK